MPGKIITWVKAHQTETWLGAGGVAVAAFALWRRHAANAAAGALPPGTTTIGAYTPGASQLTPTSDGTTSDGADVQSQINDALSGVEQQLANLTTAPVAGLPVDTTGMPAANNDVLSAALASIATAINGSHTPGGVLPAAAAARPAATYTFKPGDTIESVAAAHGTTVTGLLAANPGSGMDFAGAGHAITLPTAATPSGPRPSIVYAPGKGATVQSIAKEFGVTVAQLQAANSKSGRPLATPGHRITIPGH